MKRLASYVFLSLIILTGCTAIPAPTITPSAMPSGTVLPTLTATKTAVSLQTAIPLTTPTPLLTDLPIPTPTTILPTATVIPTTTIPIPTGRIYFFWDPATFTSGVPPIAPKQNIYLALPGTAYNDWQIQTLLDRHLDWNIEAPSHPIVTLSPDETMFTLRVNHDANGDGDVDSEWGGDGYSPYIYRLTDDFLWRINSPIFNSDLDWFPDSNRIAFTWGKEIYQLRLDELNPRVIAGPFAGDIFRLRISSSGNLLAFIGNISPIDATGLYIYNLLTHETLGAVPDMFFYPHVIIWSSDEQWLLANKTGAYGLILVKAETGELVWQSNSPAYTPVWSSDSTQFWFADRLDENFFLTAFQTADLRTIPIISGTTMSSPFLSADGQEVAVFFLDEEKPTIALVDTQNNEPKAVFTSPEIPVGEIVAWSPDNEWLLFVGTQTLPEQDPITGIFVIHRTGYPVYLLQETKPIAVNIPPKYFYWLP